MLDLALTLVHHYHVPTTKHAGFYFAVSPSPFQRWVNAVSGPGGAANDKRDIHEKYFSGREVSEKSAVTRVVRASAIGSKLEGLVLLPNCIAVGIHKYFP